MKAILVPAFWTNMKFLFYCYLLRFLIIHNSFLPFLESFFSCHKKVKSAYTPANQFGQAALPHYGFTVTIRPYNWSYIFSNYSFHLIEHPIDGYWLGDGFFPSSSVLIASLKSCDVTLSGSCQLSSIWPW